MLLARYSGCGSEEMPNDCLAPLNVVKDDFNIVGNNDKVEWGGNAIEMKVFLFSFQFFLRRIYWVS